MLLDEAKIQTSFLFHIFKRVRFLVFLLYLRSDLQSFANQIYKSYNKTGQTYYKI